MSARDLQRLEAGIRQAHKQGDIKTVDVLGAELRRIQQMPVPKQAPVKKAPPKRSLIGAAVEAIPNIPSSAAEFATGFYNAVTNPIDTAGTLLDIAAGGLKTGAQKRCRKTCTISSTIWTLTPKRRNAPCVQRGSLAARWPTATVHMTPLKIRWRLIR